MESRDGSEVLHPLTDMQPHTSTWIIICPEYSPITFLQVL